MTAVLPDRLSRLLAELDELWRREPRTKLSFTEVRGATGIKIMHPAMTREWAAAATAHRSATLSDLEDLEAAGVVSVDWGASSNGRRGELRLTPAGEVYVERLAAPPTPPAEPMDSDWQQNVMPLLKAASELERQLPPGSGITQDALNVSLGRPAGDPQTATTLIQLSTAGYLRDEQSVEQVDGPIFFRLGEKALQRVAGWPGAGGDLTSDLLALIEQRLADPEVSNDERKRLERMRDTVGDVGKGVMTGLLTALIKSHTGV
jgi:hypothetical protein